MGGEHMDALGARLAQLEERMARLEAALGAAPTAPEPEPKPTPATHVSFAPAPPPAASPPAPRQGPILRVPSELGVSLADLEQQLAGRALAIVGGIALILGAIFFLSLAFSRGWIGPELRVLVGLISGGVAVAVGAAFLERRNRLLGHVLVPVGLAVISISLIGATRLYGIIPTPLGLFGSLLAGAVVAVVAVRSESQQVAAFGLISVLLAPPLLGASADTTTLAFIAVTLVGTTAIALWRSWRWLPPIAFLLTVPQAASWIAGDPEPVTALIGIALFWALNIAAAGGEELRRRKDAASSTSATVLLGTAAFVVWAGFTVLDGSLEPTRGTYLIVVAAAHIALGWFLIDRDGDRNVFGLLTIGTGIAALTMAAPNQLDAPMVPVAWSAEAAALAWVAALRRHPYSAIASAVLYILAALAVIGRYLIKPDAAATLIDADFAAFAFVLGAIAFGVWLVRDQSLRSGLAALGIGLALYWSASVLDGLPALAFATTLMVIAAVLIVLLATSRRLEWPADSLVPGVIRAIPWRPALEMALPATLVLCGALACTYLVIRELPFLDIYDLRRPAIPFTDPGAIAAGIVIVGTLWAGWILGYRRLRSQPEAPGRAQHASLLVAGAVAVYAIPFEVPPWAVVVLWVAIAVTSVVAAPRVAPSTPAFRRAGGILFFVAALAALDVTPVRRLVVDDTAVPVDAIVASVLSLGALAIGAFMLSTTWPSLGRTPWTRFVAGSFAVYAMSVLAVDIVGLRTGGPMALEELRTQGQVTLSVLWAALGVIGFVYGLRRDSQDARLGGLGLLGLATVKVFLFDLSALDVAYRVISFVGLGLLLLAGAWVSQRARPTRRAAPAEPGPAEIESPAT